MPVSGSLLQMEGSAGACSLLWGYSPPRARSGESGILLEITQPLWGPTPCLRAGVGFFAGRPLSPSLMLLGMEMDPCSLSLISLVVTTCLMVTTCPEGHTL